MRKSDARVRYTKRVLKEAFLTLLKEKPVTRITVREVCDLADVNRSTFYTHYHDCFDLQENIENELLEEFGSSLRFIRASDVPSLIEGIYLMVENHEEACRVLIFSGASPSILSRMIDLARESTINAWRARLPKASEKDLEMLYTHLSTGLMNVVVSGYDKYDREEIIRFVNSIVNASLSLYE